MPTPVKTGDVGVREGAYRAKIARARNVEGGPGYCSASKRARRERNLRGPAHHAMQHNAPSIPHAGHEEWDGVGTGKTWCPEEDSNLHAL